MEKSNTRLQSKRIAGKGRVGKKKSVTVRRRKATSAISFTFKGINDKVVAARIYDTHLYADYAELLCLALVDRKLTRSAFLGFLKRQDMFETVFGQAIDKGTGTDEDEGLGPSDCPVASVLLGANSTTTDLFDESPSGAKSVKRDSNREAFANDVFEHLRLRAAAVGTSRYPFKIDIEARQLVATESVNFNDPQRLYVFLLLCSSLNFFGDVQHSLTHTFEDLSFLVFKKMLPLESEAHFFASGESRPGGRYKGSKFEKLEKLCADINAKLKIQKEDLPSDDKGDGGIDLIGWLPVGDNANGVLAYFAQCACGKKWKDKQTEISSYRWKEMIDMKCKNVEIVFMPYYMRKSSGLWHDEHEVRSLIIDRLRLMKYSDACAVELNKFTLIVSGINSLIHNPELVA